jgi:DNA polymerase I-like protein with 3'-5' exonuclease and polymerase domains
MLFINISIMSEFLEPVEFLDTLSGKIAIDTETFADKGEDARDWQKAKLRLIQIKDDTGKKCILDTLTYINSDENITKFSEKLIDFLNTRKLIIGHNLIYDLMVLKNVFDFTCPPNIDLWCTYNTELLLRGNPEAKYDKKSREKEGYGLKPIVQKYVGIDIPKEVDHDKWGDTLTEEMLTYAITDVEYLFEIYEKQKIEANKPQVGCRLDNKQNTLMWTITTENTFLKSVVMMQHRGLALATEYQNTVEKSLTENIAMLQDKLQKLLPEKYRGNKIILTKTGKVSTAKKNLNKPRFNPRSFEDVIEFLTKEVLPNVEDPKARKLITETRKTASGKEKTGKTDKEVLKRVRDCHPAIRVIEELRKQLDLQSKLLKQIKAKSVDGRVYPTIKQLGAKTGRMSYTKPNMQGLSKKARYDSKQHVAKDRMVDLRNIIVAGKGRKFVIADYKQIELCIAAHVFQDENMTNLLNEGTDLHKYLITLVKKISMEEVSKADRQGAKAANFGLIYGQAVNGLINAAYNQYDTVLTEEQATSFIDEFFTLYYGIKDYHNMLKNDLKNNGGKQYDCYTIMGRRRHVTKSDGSGTLFNTVLNAPIQGTCADMIKASLNVLYNHIYKYGLDWYPAMTIHDEIIMDTPEDEALEGALTMQYYMEYVGSQIVETVPIKTDPFICDSWSEKVFEEKEAKNCTAVYEEDNYSKTFGYKYTEEQKKGILLKVITELDMMDDTYESGEKEEEKYVCDIDFVKAVKQLREQNDRYIESIAPKKEIEADELTVPIEDLMCDPENQFDIVKVCTNKIDSSMFDKYKTIYVHSSTNTQKTLSCAEYLAKHKDKRILFITSRVTLCADLQQPLRKVGFVDNYAFKPYYEIKEEIDKLRNTEWKNLREKTSESKVRLYTRRFKHKLCQIESIAYFNEAYWDIIVMDECTSLLVQSTAPTNKDRYKENNKMLEDMIRQARQLICMDADYDLRDHLILKTFRNPKEKILFIENTITRDEILKKSPQYQQINPEKRDKLIVKLLPSHAPIIINEILGYIAEHINNKPKSERKKLYIASGSQKFAEKLNMRIFMDYKSVTTKVIDRYVDQNYIRNTNLNDDILNYDVFIATSALTNGVNISRVYFNKIFVYTPDCTVTIRELKQMMDRVRYPIDNEITVLIRYNKNKKPATTEDIKLDIECKLAQEKHITRIVAAASKHPAIHDALSKDTLHGFECRLERDNNFFFNMFLLNRLEINKSKNMFVELFKAMWQKRGVDVIETSLDDDIYDEEELFNDEAIDEAEDKFKEAQKQVTLENKIRFVCSHSPEPKEYNDLLLKLRRGIATTDDKYLREKADFVSRFMPIFQGIRTIDEIHQKLANIYSTNNWDPNNSEHQHKAYLKLSKIIKDNGFITAEQFLRCKNNIAILKNSVLEISCSKGHVNMDQILIRQHNIFMHFIDSTSNIASYKPMMNKFIIIRAICTYLGARNTYDEEAIIDTAKLKNCMEFVNENMKFFKNTFKRDSESRGISFKLAELSDEKKVLKKLKQIINAWSGVSLKKDKSRKEKRLIVRDKETGEKIRKRDSIYRLYPNSDIKVLINKLKPIDYYSTDYNKVHTYEANKLTPREETEQETKSIIDEMILE